MRRDSMKKLLFFIGIFMCVILTGMDIYRDIAQEREKVLETRIYKEKKRKDEEYKEYFPNGKIAVESSYRNGILHGTSKHYYMNGNLKQLDFYAYGKLCGLSRSYYDDGEVESICVFKKDRLNGPWEMYYQNGNVREKGYYINDLLCGWHGHYYEDGTLSMETLL